MATFEERRNEFIDNISKTTGDMRTSQWLPVLKENRQYVRKYGWACEAFQGSGEHKAVIVMGASPAINRQVLQLQRLQFDPDFILIGISSGMKWLYEHSIKPKLCFVAEVQDVVTRWFEGIPEEFMKGITLVVDIHTNPKIMDIWKGDIKFLATWSVVKELDRKVQKWMRPVNGTGDLFPALCSQHGSATAFAGIVLESPVIIFVGSEFGFPSADYEKDKYYANRDDDKDKWYRAAHTDIYGNVAYTTYILLQNKYVLEDWCRQVSGQSIFLNATEAGIFGVEGRGDTARHLPWITPITLNMAVKQAKHIILYGEPITDKYRDKISIVSGR